MLLVAIIGFIFGFFGSVPVGGPIAVLVLGHGIEGRSRAGLYIALGAAVPEGAYAYLACWGFSELLEMHPWLDAASRVAGAVLVLGLGLWFLFGRQRASEGPKEARALNRRKGVKRNLALGFVITALNPTLLATWAAAVSLAAAVLPFRLQSTHALPFSIGACLGIASWFVLLLYLLRRFRNRVSGETHQRMIKATGVLILLVGVGLGIRAAATVL